MANVPLNLVPEDLRKIAKEISVQVLTHQPENIYKFTADYLNNQLSKRERKEDEIFIRDVIERDLTYEAMLKRWGVSIEAAHRASSVMQAAVRKFLWKQKVKREHEETVRIGNSSIVDIMPEAVSLQKETPPGDAGLLKPLQGSGNPLLQCMNTGVSEGDIVQVDNPATLAAAKNLNSFYELEIYDADNALLQARTNPRQESNKDAAKNFAESMLRDIISGIFENDAPLYEKTFDQEMEHLIL